MLPKNEVQVAPEDTIREKEEIWLVREVSTSVQRVVTGLAGAPVHASLQIDPSTRSSDAFCDMAWGHAEVLEREARNIRAAIAKFQGMDRAAD